jgi:GR25 family glycosyltransferase involved in LPS biosynthesis
MLVERAFVISLAIREDRLARFRAATAGLKSIPEIETRLAVHGDTCLPPEIWTAGAGAWGCYKSHLAILEECLNTGVGSYLVFEDDAQFRTGFDEQFQAFMEVLPDDWQQAYIGGQLLHTDSHPTVKVKENVYRPYNVNRTHAFLVSRAGMLPMYQWISNLPFYQHEHIDHHLGRWHEDQRNAVYTPARWLVGQMGTSSNVSGKSEPPEFFTDPIDTALSHWLYDDPVCVVFHGDRSILQKCRGYLHQGNQLDANGYDVTLALASKMREPQVYIDHWFGWIRGEIVRSNSKALPCLFHARITPDMLAGCGFRTIELQAKSVEQVKEFHEAFYAQRGHR